MREGEGEGEGGGGGRRREEGREWYAKVNTVAGDERGWKTGRGVEDGRSDLMLMYKA